MLFDMSPLRNAGSSHIAGADFNLSSTQKTSAISCHFLSITIFLLLVYAIRSFPVFTKCVWGRVKFMFEGSTKIA